MINRGYASGQQNARDSNEPQSFGANQSANAIGSSQNINSVQNAVATLLGEPIDSQDNTRAMLYNLVRQEAIEEDQSFESDN